MSTPITINGTVYNVPSQGENAPWGDELSDFLVALAGVVNSVVGSSDILTTNTVVANNQAVAASVTGATFDTATVRSAIITYSIYRSTSTSESTECGFVYLNYKSTAGTWDLAVAGGGSSGITFTITTGGQLQYTSTNLSGTGYVGKLKYQAKSFLQT